MSVIFINFIYVFSLVHTAQLKNQLQVVSIILYTLLITNIAIFS